MYRTAFRSWILFITMVVATAGFVHAESLISIDPAGRFVLYSGAPAGCMTGGLNFIQLDGAGNPDGSPFPLTSCGLLSGNVFGLDLLIDEASDEAFIAFGSEHSADSKYLMQINAEGFVLLSPTAVFPASSFGSVPGAIAMAAKGSRKIRLWVAGAEGGVYRTLVDKATLTPRRVRKTSMTTEDPLSLSATQRDTLPVFLAMETRGQILKAYSVDPKTGLPNGSSWRLSPRTDGGSVWGGISADGLMAYSNNADPPLNQLYIQPLNPNGLPDGDPSVVANDFILAADVSGLLPGNIRYVVYLTSDGEVYLQRIDGFTAAKIGGRILLTTGVNLTPPMIVSFTATPSAVNADDPSTLEWTTLGATSCSIDFGVGPVPCNGSTGIIPHPANAIANGSFETGDFTGWTPVDIGIPYYSLRVGTAGLDAAIDAFVGFVSAPTDGTYAALNGFDGNGPGVIQLGQPVVVPAAQITYTLTATGIGGSITATAAVTNLSFAGTSALRFDFRAGWDMTYDANLDRTFGVEIRSVGDNLLLQTIELLTAEAGDTVNDTGDLAGNIDLSAYSGQTVFINFYWDIPENFTGPAFFQLDDVRLTSP